MAHRGLAEAFAEIQGIEKVNAAIMAAERARERVRAFEAASPRSPPKQRRKSAGFTPRSVCSTPSLVSTPDDTPPKLRRPSVIANDERWVEQATDFYFHGRRTPPCETEVPTGNNSSQATSARSRSSSGFDLAVPGPSIHQTIASSLLAMVNPFRWFNEPHTTSPQMSALPTAGMPPKPLAQQRVKT